MKLTSFLIVLLCLSEIVKSKKKRFPIKTCGIINRWKYFEIYWYFL